MDARRRLACAVHLVCLSTRFLNIQEIYMKKAILGFSVMSLIVGASAFARSQDVVATGKGAEALYGYMKMALIQEYKSSDGHSNTIEDSKVRCIEYLKSADVTDTDHFECVEK